MAAFSSFQQHNPFLVDTILLPSHNNTSINVPPYKLDSITQPYNPSNFPFNPFSNTNALSLDSIALMNSFDDILSQENSSSHVKKLSTTTESSSAPSASHRRRKTHNGSINSKEEREGGKSKRQKKGEEGKDKTRSEEPPKDYIHVRARRGQATDSHSLAERVRREKISERMRILQKLVPGCDKVTGKALMLDEIINYVQSLQNQVEFLSMKLASISPVVYDFGEDLDAFIVRPEMGQVGGATRFPPLVDNSLLHPHLPLDQGNINDEEQRQKIQNPSGFTDNSFCSFP